MISATVLTLSLFASAATVDSPRINCTLLDGGQIEGELHGIDERGLFTIKTGGSPRNIPREDIVFLQPVSPQPATSRPAGILTFLLSNGDVLCGLPAGPQPSGADGLILELGLRAQIRVPIQALAAVRFATAGGPHEEEFDARVKSRVAGRDLLLLIRDAKIVAVPGALDSLSGSHCAFRVNQQVRTIPLHEAYGVILGSVVNLSRDQPAIITLHQGSRVSATIERGDSQTLRVDADSLGRIELHWREIAQISFRSGRMVYLSDLEPDRRESRGIMGAIWPVQLDKSISGGALSIRSRKFRKGIGVHADCAVSFRLGGEFERFNSTVGIDDEVSPGGSVIFRVKVDDRVIFESPVLGGLDKPLPLSLDVSGGQKLTLEADMADDLDISDHANWAAAALIRKK